MTVTMVRRSMIAAAAAMFAPCLARAQGAATLPPDAPGATARDDAQFSAELLDGMMQGESLARERLPTFRDLRVLRRQVPRNGWNGVESYYMQQMAVTRRWGDAGVTRPQGRSAFLPPQGWIGGGTSVLVIVGAHPTRAEKGLLPFSILTNLRDA